MDFNLTEEQMLIRDTVRDFAEREIKPLAKDLDEKQEFSNELTTEGGFPRSHIADNHIQSPSQPYR